MFSSYRWIDIFKRNHFPVQSQFHPFLMFHHGNIFLDRDRPVTYFCCLKVSEALATNQSGNFRQRIKNKEVYKLRKCGF